MNEKLTYDEFMKAASIGAISGPPCACMGPQNDEPFCPCSMGLLSFVDEPGQVRLTAEWKAREEERRQQAAECEKKKKIPFPSDNPAPRAEPYVYDPKETW